MTYLRTTTREAATPPPPPAAADKLFRELGYRHIVLNTWLAELPSFAKPTGEYEYPGLPMERMVLARERLESVFGAPCYEDDQIVAFELR